MGKFLKNALVFAGGMAAGTYCVTKAALKSKTFTEALMQTVERKTADAVNQILFRPTDDSGKKTFSYHNYYKRGSPVRYGSNKVNYTHFIECDDLIFGSRGDAEKVLEAMSDVLQQYDIVTVADFYELADIGQAEYAMSKYGWCSLDGATVVHTRDGYHIKLPRAIEVK